MSGQPVSGVTTVTRIQTATTIMEQLEYAVRRDNQVGDLGRMIAFTANIKLEVNNVGDVMDEIANVAKELGGYVAGTSSTIINGKQVASITIRVPRNSFYQAIADIETLGRVVEKNTQSDDVTEEYIDLRARRDNLLRQEERLLETMRLAASVDDLLSMERELERVRGEIERLTGRINYLENTVSFSTIRVELLQAQLPTKPRSAFIILESQDVANTLAVIEKLARDSGGYVVRSSLRVANERWSGEIVANVPADIFDELISKITALGETRNMETKTSDTSQITVSILQPAKPTLHDIDPTEPFITGVTLLYTILRGLLILVVGSAPLATIALPLYLFLKRRTHKKNAGGGI
ncbi:MAG: DUF4349 domain-containing protein [Aigarchaeota archaeon]|nr:DUF4349 domain-containing protein [Candidatus Pelearchaeum maunauluense]